MSVINLPEGYVQLEYIEQPLGLNAYINTGVLASNSLDFEIELMNYDTINTSGHCLFGCRTTGAIFQINSYSNNTTLRKGSVEINGVYYNADIDPGTISKISLFGATLTVNGVSTEVTRDLSVFDQEMYVFVDNVNGAAGTQQGHGRIYKLTTYENNEVTHNFIPCANLQNIRGLYDTVTNTFHPSSLEGASINFSGGPIVEDSSESTTYSDDISGKLLEIYGIKENLRKAINSKYTTGPLASTDGLVEFATAIDNIPNSSELPTENKAVNFIDYDGTLLYAYTAAEFTALNGMPNNPYHSGLIAQGWNWRREQILDYLTRAERIDVGQNYITDDGATRLYIELKELVKQYVLITQNISYGVKVDWGDGSEYESLSGTGAKTFSHDYAATGRYIIRLIPEDGCILQFTDSQATNTGGTTIFGQSTNGRISGMQNLYKAEIGKNVTDISSSTFYCASRLKTVTLPISIGLFNGAAFNACYQLQAIVVPPNVRAFNANVFTYDHSLKYISIPPGVGYIGTVCFQECYSLTNVLVPDTVTSINGSGFLYRATKVNTIYISRGLTTLGGDFFRDCNSLTHINVPDNITTLGQYTFAAERLITLEIPEGVTAIPAYCMQNNYSLFKCVLPSTLTSMGANSLRMNKASDRIVICKATTPPTIGTNSIGIASTGLKIYVPYSEDHSVLTAYQEATNWTSLASYLVELDENGEIPTE